MKLCEYMLDQMNISGITNRAISNYGLGQSWLISASISNDQLQLMYEVQSSRDDNKHVDLKGNFQDFLKNGYSVRFEFYEIDEILPQDWRSRNEQEVSQYIKNILDVCDCKVHCDCPAFYWQGMQEEDSKKKTSYFNFSGTPGRDIWQSKHRESGGFTSGQQICKHIFNVKHDLLYDNDNMVKEILEKLKYDAPAASQEQNQKVSNASPKPANDGATPNEEGMTVHKNGGAEQPLQESRLFNSILRLI